MCTRHYEIFHPFILYLRPVVSISMLVSNKIVEKDFFCKIKKHVPEAITKYYSQNIPSALWILFDSHIHDFQLNIKVKSCSLVHACAVDTFLNLMTSLLPSRDDHVIMKKREFMKNFSSRKVTFGHFFEKKNCPR